MSTSLRSARRPARLAALLAVPLLLVSACSGGSVERAEVEKQTKAQLEKNGAYDVDSVECPDDLDATEGKTMTCKVTLADGMKLDAALEVSSVKDGQATWDVKVTTT